MTGWVYVPDLARIHDYPSTGTLGFWDYAIAFGVVGIITSVLIHYGRKANQEKIMDMKDEHDPIRDCDSTD